MNNSRLTWSKHDSTSTETHTYRIEVLSNNVSVIYGKKDEQQMQYNDLDSVQAAKQWAQNYNDKFGDNENE